MAEPQPFSDYLLEGPQRQPADMRVQSGYPIWILVSVWRVRGDSDTDVVAEYGLDPRESQAAKRYYLAHQAEIDTRRARNDQAGVALPGAILIEDLLATNRSPAGAPSDDTQEA